MKYQNLHQDLIDGLFAEDRKAQFEIYKLYYKAMYNTCLRIVCNSTEAEDVVQEAFLAGFKKISTYKGEVSFGAWLKKIVINKSLDHIKASKLKFVEIDKNYNQTEIEETIFEDNENLEFKLKIIKECINELADGYRIVLSLYLLEGYDHDEIGEILNISASTSRSQFTRAKVKLLQVFNEKSICYEN